MGHVKNTMFIKELIDNYNKIMSYYQTYQFYNEHYNVFSEEADVFMPRFLETLVTFGIDIKYALYKVEHMKVRYIHKYMSDVGVIMYLILQSSRLHESIYYILTGQY